MRTYSSLDSLLTFKDSSEKCESNNMNVVIKIQKQERDQKNAGRFALNFEHQVPLSEVVF